MSEKSYETMIVVADVLNIRQKPAVDSQEQGEFYEGTIITVGSETDETDDYTWRQIHEPEAYRGNWVARMRKSDGQEFLESKKSGAGVDQNPRPLRGGRFSLVKGQDGMTRLAIDGDTQPRIGVNVRPFAWLGKKNWKHAPPNAQETFAKQAANMGATWMRLYVPRADYDVDVIVSRLQTALDTLAGHDLLAVVCLGDMLSDMFLYPPGDQEEHKKGDEAGLFKGALRPVYFAGGEDGESGYRSNYRPLVKEIVRTFKDHPAVGMWQLMNEPGIYPDPVTEDQYRIFRNFVQDVSRLIYTIDPSHPISIGVKYTPHYVKPSSNGDTKADFATAFYNDLPHIHVVTAHAYENEAEAGSLEINWGEVKTASGDIEAAERTGRAFFWTEFSTHDIGQNRENRTKRFLKEQLIHGRASGALQWAFVPEGMKASGAGDSERGMGADGINNDYGDLYEMYRQFPFS